MDGASEMRMFRSITVPLLRPILALVLIITVVGSFQVFDTVAVTTAAGRSTPRGCCSTTSTTSRSGASSSATPRRCRWRCWSSSMVVTFVQYRMTRAGSTDLD